MAPALAQVEVDRLATLDSLDQALLFQGGVDRRRRAAGPARVDAEVARAHAIEPATNGLERVDAQVLEREAALELVAAALGRPGPARIDSAPNSVIISGRSGLAAWISSR